MNQIENLNDNIDNILNLLLVNFKDHNITVYGTWDEPLFKASEIGKMLEIVKIRDTIEKID
jgi:prophage antirepressor-like protein